MLILALRLILCIYWQFLYGIQTLALVAHSTENVCIVAKCAAACPTPTYIKFRHQFPLIAINFVTINDFCFLTELSRVSVSTTNWQNIIILKVTNCWSRSSLNSWCSFSNYECFIPQYKFTALRFLLMDLKDYFIANLTRIPTCITVWRINLTQTFIFPIT